MNRLANLRIRRKISLKGVVVDFKSSSLSKCLGLTLWIASGSAYGGPCKDFSKDPTNSAETKIGNPLRMDVIIAALPELSKDSFNDTPPQSVRQLK